MLPRLPSTDYQSKTENLVVRQGAWLGRNAYMPPAASRPGGSAARLFLLVSRVDQFRFAHFHLAAPFIDLGMHHCRANRRIDQSDDAASEVFLGVALTEVQGRLCTGLAHQSAVALLRGDGCFRPLT